MKATEEYFPGAVCHANKVVLNFEYVDEILKCDLANESY